MGVGRAEEAKENNVVEKVYFLSSEKMRSIFFLDSVSLN
jgi:hypothetical protein